MKHGVDVAGRLPDELPVPDVADHDLEPDLLPDPSGRVGLCRETVRGFLEITK